MSRRPLKLLVVEDSDDDAELLVLELQTHGFDVTHRRAATRADVEQALESGCWDIVVCDHGLPGFTSRDALALLRSAAPDVPFVVLSGTIGEEAAVEALRSGVRDVVLKTNLSRLGPVVQRELEEAEHRRRRRQAEEALLESDARKTAILESALDAVVTVDADGRIVDFNPAAEAMFGYPREQVAGEPFLDRIVPPPLRSRCRSGLAAHLGAGEGSPGGRRIEVTAMRADGSEFPAELSVSRGVLHGQPFFTAYVRDLTDQKLAEAERASLEAQLGQAQKMEAIGRLAGGITHDFNNLLTVIRGYSELVLAGEPPGGRIRELVEQIRLAGEHASELTEQLLAFSRQRPFDPRVVDLNTVVLSVEPMLRRLIGEDVELVTRMSAEPLSVRADPGRLEQVVMNLAVNARDAMPAGGRLVLATAADSELHGAGGGEDFAVLTVEDTGTGMDEETASRAFEPFFTTKEPGKGTGLGLSTVYGIVTQSGGRVRIDSEPGRGTTVAIELPLVKGAPKPAAARRATVVPVCGAGVILLVEDDEALRRLIRLALEEAGYTVMEAADGREALEVAARPGVEIDLTISDVVMPGMNGADFARELEQRRPGARLLLMSGYMERGGVDPRLPEAAAFIPKPFSLAELQERVRALLEG